MDEVFYSVNEEGKPYGRFDYLVQALPNLREFPNDTIVVCTIDSPADMKLRRELQ